MAISSFLLIGSQAAAQFESNINSWVTQDERNPPPQNAILFVGDSTIRAWESLTQDFNDYNIIQRGFGSATVTNLIQYIDEIVLPYEPAAIVMSNRSSRSRNDQAVQNHINLFELIHSKQRQDRTPIPILFISEFPRLTTLNGRWPDEDQPRNTLLKEYAMNSEYVFYVDTATRMSESASAPGMPPDERLFATDRHHHNEEGYLYWHQPIREALELVIAPNKIFELNRDRPVAGERLLVDFGRISTDSPDVNGNHWNSWHTDTSNSILAGQSLGDLITTEGRATSVDLIVTGEFDALTTGLRAPNADLLEDLAIEAATRDTFARGSLSSSIGVPNAGFMFTGLDPESAYDFRFFASLRSNRDRVARYSVVGAGVPMVQDLTLASAEDGQNNDKTVDFTGIQPDRFGQIFVDLQPVNGRHDGYIGIMELTVGTADLLGDLDGDGVLSATDIDLLGTAIQNGLMDRRFDLDVDSSVSSADYRHWVTELRQTWIGDANLDGEFNSSDFVRVFQIGKYETGQETGWGEGDWNGDGVFSSGDFVTAFQDGGYERGPRAGAFAVPEPVSRPMLLAGLFGLAFCLSEI